MVGSKIWGVGTGSASDLVRYIGKVIVEKIGYLTGGGYLRVSLCDDFWEGLGGLAVSEGTPDLFCLLTFGIRNHFGDMSSFFLFDKVCY